MEKSNKVSVVCKICGKTEKVYPSRAKRYFTCSLKCMAEYNRNKYSENITKQCDCCGTKFNTKTSHLNRRKYCSKQCQAIAYTTRYNGKNNPNYRHRTSNTDGYCVDIVNGKSKTIHVAVVYEYLNISNHNGYHIHHRDCNKHNNVLSNLVVITNSDHLWLHKQFGNATLWAYCNGKIQKDTLIEWSDNKERARNLLDLTVLQQDSAVLKLGEFRESLEIDNPELSQENE